MFGRIRAVGVCLCICFALQIVHVTSVVDPICMKKFSRSKRDAVSFLKTGGRVRRSTPTSCCHEEHCESTGTACYTEEYRRYICTLSPQACSGNQICSVTSWCPGHQSTNCKDICQALGVNRCNNGTCNSVSSSRYNCRCYIGFSGIYCENDVCSHGNLYRCDRSKCTGTPDAFKCQCNQGFTGNHCEININECLNNSCQNGATCIDGVNGYTCGCIPGYTGFFCGIDIDECSSNPCQHGGTCMDRVNRYTCACVTGYTGSNCEIDVDECASNPCHNNATCENKIGRFHCSCASGWYDVLCDRDVCRPVPADVLFILDSSVSMTEQEFRKQLAFIKNFTDGIKVGSQDFQISIITFSFDAKIEFYLNNYTSNSALKTAIDKIQYVPGATYTNKALDLAKQVFSASNGAGQQLFGPGPEDDRRDPESIVYVLTDGMSTRRDETKSRAMELKKVVNRVIAIGIGPQVSHQELIDIATEPGTSSETNVFSVSNFDALFTLVKRLAKIDCKDCSHSTASDVAIFVDTSGSQTRAQFHASLEAMKYFVSQVSLGPEVNDTHVAAFTFDSMVHRRFGFLEHNDINQLQSALQSISFVGTGNANFSEVMNAIKIGTFTHSNDARNETDARQFVVIFTNGKIDPAEKHRFEAEKAKLQGRVTIIAIGAGEWVSVEGLLGLATDPYHAFYIDIDPDDNRLEAKNVESLKALQNEFAYNICNKSGH